MTFERGRLILQAWEEYSQFFTPCNWRTFRLALFELEDDAAMGIAELTVVVLGLGFRVAWVYDWHTPMREELNSMVEGYRP